MNNLNDQQIREMLAELNDEATEVRKIKFASFDDMSRPYAAEPDLNLFQNLRIDIKVELSNTNMCLREVLNLEDGHVIRLNKLAGEPVDVKFNEEIFAKGEVVIINEVFGIRISSLVADNAE